MQLELAVFRLTSGFAIVDDIPHATACIMAEWE